MRKKRLPGGSLFFYGYIYRVSLKGHGTCGIARGRCDSFSGVRGVYFGSREVRGVVFFLDAFVGLNFLVDLCLLLGVTRLSGHPPGMGRAAAAAALGGGYAGPACCRGLGFSPMGFGGW